MPQVKDIRTPIVLDSLNCRRDEANLGQCGRAPVVEYCSHSDDAGANCTIIIGIRMLYYITRLYNNYTLFCRMQRHRYKTGST